MRHGPDRRQFLRGLAAGGLALSAAGMASGAGARVAAQDPALRPVPRGRGRRPSINAEPGPDLRTSPKPSFLTTRRMKIDLVCANIGVNVKFPEAVALATKHGFESVAPDLVYLSGLTDGAIAELLGSLYQNNLTTGAAPLNVDFRGEESTFRAMLKDLPRDAQIYRRAGVTRLTTWIAPADGHLTYMANFGRHTERLRQIGAVLGDHGLRLGLEYVGPKTAWSSKRFPFIHTMDETRELIDAIGRTNVGLVLDSWHWYCAGETPDDIRSLSAREVVACDLNDAPAKIPVDQQIDNHRELPCATGVIDVKGFLGALRSIGYEGPVRAEPFNSALRALPADEAVGRTAAAMKAAFALIGG